MRDGQGSYKYPSGDSYIGEFKSNLRNGHGKYKWAFGGTFTGQYENGFRHGFGSEEHSNGAIKYEGNYKKGEFHDRGVLTISGVKYDGFFTLGKRHGIFRVQKGEKVWSETWVEGTLQENGEMELER